MIPLLRNRPQYQIQMQQNEPYPFNGPIPPKFTTTVKLTLPFNTPQSPSSSPSTPHQPQQPHLHQSIKKLLTLQHECLIKISKITESHLKHSYTIIYEYVPYKFTYPCVEFQEYIKLGKYRTLLYQMFCEILRSGIRPILRLENFGYDQKLALRMFLRPGFQGYDGGESGIDKLATSYVNECQKMFNNTQSTEKFKIKVSNLSQKLKKIQNEILTKDFRRRQKKQSQSIRNSSEYSDSVAKTGSNEKIGNAQWHFDHDFHFQDSYSVRDPKIRKKKRTSSFKEDQKPKSESKQKKASWEASWKQEKSSNVESDKITVLKRRISQALFKTQKTLTKYQKIKNRGQRKRRPSPSQNNKFQ